MKKLSWPWTAALCLGGCSVLLSLWLGAADFQFSNIRSVTNREIALTVSGGTSTLYRIETSSNLFDWSGLVTLPLVPASLQHTDSAAPYLDHRLYRASQLTGTNIMTGDHLVTTNGEVVLHPLKHASFVISWQGKTIYNDPTNGSIAFPGLPKADLILVGHEHGDHFSASTLDAVRGPSCVIIAPQTVYNMMSTTLRAITTVLTNGGSANVIGLTVEAVPAYNPVATYHPKGNGNGYVLTIGGRRIYMSGDTEDVPEMRALPNIDVAFVCMNLPFTMSITNAASAVRQFRPKVIYPYHYRNMNGTFSDLSDFKRRVGQDVGVEVRLRNWY